jgi:hypothetical protein
MSLDTKGQKCAACSAYLFDDDDIVYCPVCGAPHHRDCYTALGKCALEEHHGTEYQYKKPEEVPDAETQHETATPEKQGNSICQRCGNSLSENDRFCNSCGMPAGAAFGGFSPFAQVVEIKDNTIVAEDVTALEAAKIVRVNAFRYIPKFLQMSKDKKRSWNWAAFILPGGWFAYRKMYKESIITTIFMIMTMLCNIPFNLVLSTLPAPGNDVRTYLQIGEYYAGYMSEIGTLPLVLAAIGLAASMILRIVCGIFGDYFYKCRVVQSARLIREAEDTEAAERKYCGVSFIGFILAVASMEFIPGILAMLFV